MQKILKLAFAITALAIGWGYGISAMAQQPSNPYPAKPVRIIMPLGPGNSLEIALRLVAEKLSATFGQPFIIEAQPGAAGQIGTERVARAPADGYTLLAANDGIITMLPNLQKNVPYDPIRDFSPITNLVGIPFVLIAHPSVSAKTAQELVQLAKARPGGLEFSSGGHGSAQQLAMELFMTVTGTKLTHIPYKGAPQAAMDVVSGQIPVALAGVPIVAALIKEGKLRALGIASDERLPLLADTPTLAEQGIPLRFTAWGGLFAPAGTPSDVVHKLSEAAAKALRSPDIQARMAEFGLETYGNSPEEFAETMKADFAKMARVIRDAGIRPQ
jgi:tripartite-type tricarboxylate transporter receptor subunit TctC